MKVNCKHGTFHIYEEDDYVSKSLGLLGEYGEIEIEDMAHFWGPDKVVVDIGANIGAYSVPMAKANKELIAIEPQRMPFQNLNANLVENGITNGITHQVALGRQRKIVRVPDMIGDNPGSHFPVDVKTGRHSVNGTMGYREGVPMSDVQMVQFIDKVPMSKQVHFIKIDVEGFELEILRSMREYIRRWKPCMFLETDRNELRQPVHEWIYNHGYKFVENWYPLYRENNWMGLKRNPFLDAKDKPMGCINTIAVPTESTEWDELLKRRAG